jgi:hypothetical protein
VLLTQTWVTRVSRLVNNVFVCFGTSNNLHMIWGKQHTFFHVEASTSVSSTSTVCLLTKCTSVYVCIVNISDCIFLWICVWISSIILWSWYWKLQKRSSNYFAIIGSTCVTYNISDWVSWNSMYRIFVYFLTKNSSWENILEKQLVIQERRDSFDRKRKRYFAGRLQRHFTLTVLNENCKSGFQ